MIPLTDHQMADYFHRSYKTVDGLWFMKVEQRMGFDAALDIDNEVWKVMPKIQARKLKELTGLTSGLEALCECLTTRLAIESFEFTTDRDADDTGFSITSVRCPWYDLLTKSNRQHLAGKIGNLICNTEYSAWAAEFGDDIRVKMDDRICTGCSHCTIRFERIAPPG